MKKALSIAGSDCGGGAGIQADLKTFAAHGVYGMTVITSVVAENTRMVLGSQDVSPEIVERQIDAVFEDIGTDSVKIGMLPSAACMETVARALKKYGPQNIVIDPVMVSKSGCALMRPEAENAFIEKILPLADLLTPNIPEAEKLAGMSVQSFNDMELAARRILALGAKSVLVKGGHAIEKSGFDRKQALDLLLFGGRAYHFGAERIATKNTHGTGCTYSSAIASNLALGFSLPEAVRRAKRFLTGAIRHSLELGGGWGPTDPFWSLYPNGLKPNVS